MLSRIPSFAPIVSSITRKVHDAVPGEKRMRGIAVQQRDTEDIAKRADSSMRKAIECKTVSYGEAVAGSTRKFKSSYSIHSIARIERKS